MVTNEAKILPNLQERNFHCLTTIDLLFKLFKTKDFQQSIFQFTNLKGLFHPASLPHAAYMWH